MSITRVQEARNAPGTAGVTTRSVTVASTGAGNLILVVVITGSTTQCTHNTPTDNASGSTAYSLVATLVDGANAQRISVYKKLSSQAGATSVTSTISVNPGNFFDVYVAEYSSAGATWTANTPASAAGNSASASSGNFSRSTGDLLFGAALTPTTSATNLTNLVDTTDGNGIGDTLGAANGTAAAATFTTTSGVWICVGSSFTPTTASVSTSIDGDEQSQRFSQTSRMESQHQQEISETFAILPQLPPFAYEDDGANMRWSDWRALLHEDPETHRALPPVPPVSIQEEFTESVWVDWRARQFEDTDTHRALPPTPPFAIQDEHADEKNFNWSAVQYEDAETQRVLPPTPPFAIQDEVSDCVLPGIVPFFEEDQAPKPIVAAAAPNIGLDDAEAHIKAYDRVNVYHEDDLSTFAPTPPVSIQDDEQHTWRAWSAAAIEDDWRALPPTPPFVVPDDTAEKWSATSAPAIEDDQATIPPVPPIVPFSIQDDEQHSWRGWLSPHIEADWTTAAPVPPLAFEDDLKTISSNPVFFSLVETDLVGIPPLPRFFGDDERSLQRYMVAGLSGLILLDDFVNAPIATGLGPFTLTSLSASVRPGIDSLGAAVRSSMESQGAVIRPGIDSLSAAIRASMESKGAAVRPGIDSAGAIVRPS